MWSISGEPEIDWRPMAEALGNRAITGMKM
jgi:hypothetical protein